ncbi:MAG TPA: radical SAM family heme chaperone HemW [Burkholderiaceae bacterium]|nr:radical SAM family heme chaperone HemW [Burkholderiaceae bacterium]
MNAAPARVTVAPARDRPVGVAQSPPLALYVHIPWCLRKCPYCDFNSHQADAIVPEREYVDALQADLQASVPQVWGRSVQSVFIGGGTPSLFSPESIDRLLGIVRALLRLAPNAEVTMEANPGTFERGRFAGFREAGVNRLSLGIQSFDDKALQSLGRVHDASQAQDAIEAAATLFENFNIDLMYALPLQTLEKLDADLRQALAYRPPHLSYYHLTLEPNTLFAKFPPPLPDDDTAHRMQELIEERAAAAGYSHYEVSAYSQPERRSRHNLNYWSFGDYLGIGAGAHGKLSFADRIVRSARYRHPRRYIDAALAGNAIETQHELPARDLPFEFMLNALRLRDGVPSAYFPQRTGLPLAVIAGPLRRAVERGLLDRDPAVIRATPLGWRFLNDLQQMFLPD